MKPTEIAPSLKWMKRVLIWLIVALVLFNVVPRVGMVKALPQNRTKIHVFYNLFVKDEADETEVERVSKIVKEQFSMLRPSLHDKLSISSIGHQLDLSNSPIKKTSNTHYESGDESYTLHALWSYCKDPKNNNPETKVAYIHSKGSFHSHPANEKLRAFVTRAALSEECAHLPETCNVCSSRMSPLPHPHTSGNMWLAKCNYIAKLIDPFALKEGKLPEIFTEDDGCRGFGRFFFEHWVHSHPYVRPCDLYPGKDFTWEYEGIPDTDSVMELRMAPRFPVDVYRKEICHYSPEQLMEHRMSGYKYLYNISPPDHTWWGWEVFNGTTTPSDWSWEVFNGPTTPSGWSPSKSFPLLLLCVCVLTGMKRRLRTLFALCRLARGDSKMKLSLRG